MHIEKLGHLFGDPMAYPQPVLTGTILIDVYGVKYADMHAARLLGMALDAVQRLSMVDLLARFTISDRERINAAISAAASGAVVPILEEVCLERPGEMVCLDVLVDQTLYNNRNAIRLVCFDRTTSRISDDRLRTHVQRLQILHEIDQAILSVQDEQSTAQAALSRIAAFIPHSRYTSVLLIEQPPIEEMGIIDSRSDGSALLLAVYPPDVSHAHDGELITLDELGVDLRVLQDGLPYIIHDMDALTNPSPAQEALRMNGVRSYLSAPLRWGGRLFGLLNLAADRAEVFKAEHVQIAQEVADSLAVAIREARLRRAERQRQQETQVMRDVMAALASASDLRQTLEALLVNLHNLIEYDRAGLYLVDENDQMVRMDRPIGKEGAPALFLEDHPLVREMRRTRSPLASDDIRDDPRFQGFPEVETVRSWLGAPLLAGEQLLGFISIGALNPNVYTPGDVEAMRMFAAEVSQVLERAWMDEQSHRRSAELEVLSNITFALGNVEPGSDTPQAILTQVAQFFGANMGALLVHDSSRNNLVIQAATDDELIGYAHPYSEDKLWQVFSGQQVVVENVGEYLNSEAPEILNRMLGASQSAALIPLASFGATFGLLSLAFDSRRRFTSQTNSLFHAVAEIAAASLRRAVVLEALEKQVKIRTQHLSTLYRINSAAGEALPVRELLDRVLETAMEALKGSAAFVLLFNEDRSALVCAATSGSQPTEALGEISTRGEFWRSLLTAPEPTLLPELASYPEAKEALAGLGAANDSAFIGTAIRTKGEALGIICLFGETILNYTIDDITLFSTIADQIGGLVERARLLTQAELAAVVQERQRLARELHDSVTQLLYSQVLFSGAGLKELLRGNQPLAEKHLARIEQAAQQALKEMRLLVYELRPSDELNEGLAAALERRLDAVERRTGVMAQLIVNGEARLDHATSMSLYRIAEEALNNTLKHAGATTVLVVLRFADDQVILEIADDGKGFDVDALRGGGMGLANMRERTSHLGGEITLESGVGQGTRIVVRLMIAQA